MKATGHCVVVTGGNSIAGCEDYDICFGGRRQFCKADYSDLGTKISCCEDILLHLNVADFLCKVMFISC